jgi:hypothetical protein
MTQQHNIIDIAKLGESKISHPVEVIEQFQQSSDYRPNIEPKFTNPIKLNENTMNNFDIFNGFMIPQHFKKANSFYMCCLYIIDTSIAANKLINAKMILKSFRNDLIKHLTSEKQLYKKLGFNKKRTLTPEKLSEYLTEEDSINVEVLTYLSRLLKNDFVIMNKKNTSITKKDHTTTCIFKVFGDNFAVYHTVVENDNLPNILNNLK